MSAVTARTVTPGLGLHLDDRVPAELRDRLLAGEVVLFVGRNSNPGGTQGRRGAATNLREASEILAGYGVDGRHLVPTPQHLVTAMRAGQRTVTAAIGHGDDLRIHVYEHADAADRGVVLLMLTGSGLALDADDQQPAAAVIRDAVRRYRPAVLCVPEVRALCRDPQALSPVVLALRREHSYYADRTTTLRPLDPAVEDYLYDQARAAQEEAARFQARTLAAARVAATTTTTARDGRFVHDRAATLPPPLTTARLANPFGGRGERIGFYDTPGCRPEPGQVASGLPARFGPDGAPVDQLALLRFFYTHWRQPGWGNRAMARWLIDHGYSTEAVRRYRGRADAQMVLRPEQTEHRDAYKICHSIWDHRQFHHTGWLTVRAPGEQTLRLHLPPPDGHPVCTPDDLARIEAALAHTRSVRPGGRVGTLTGHPGVLDGEEVTLHLHHLRSTGAAIYRYEYARAPGGPRRRRPAPTLSHDALAEAIAEAAKPQPLWPDLPTRADRREQAEVELRQAHARVRHALQAEQQIRATLHQSVLTGAARTEVNRLYNEADRELTTSRVALAELEADLATEPSVSGGLNVTDWFRFVVSLRDPFDPTFRALLRRDLSPLTLTTRRAPCPGDRSRVAVRFRATLALTDGHGAHGRLLLDGVEYRRGGADLLDQLHDIIAAMRTGVPFRRAAGPNFPEYAPYLRVALGHPAHGRCRVLNVTDPRLLSVVMAAQYPPYARPARGPWTGDRAEDVPRLVRRPLGQSDLAALAARTGEDLPLLQRVQHVHADVTGGEGRWLRCYAPRVAALLDRAARGPVAMAALSSPERQAARHCLVVRGDLAEAPACSHCGSHRRARPLLREIAGLLCRDCRRDEAGQTWPADPYDRYLDP